MPRHATLMPSLVRKILLAICIAALAGCAATVRQTPTTSSSPAVTAPTQAPSGTLVAVVTGSPEMKASRDWPLFVQEWEAALGASATNAGLPFSFAKEEASLPANASVLVRLKVNDFRYLSTVSRFMVGVLAGNAYMDLDADYIELPANKLLGSKKFNTSSSAWEGIFSAVTPRQVQTVSDIIVRDVVSGAPARTRP